MPNTREPSARDAYKERNAKALKRLESLKQAVIRHGKSFKDDESDWGFVGDLGHVIETLDELCAFMGADKD